jgi:dTDP-4-amino-4,6-dideoxygalactose transaminase
MMTGFIPFNKPAYIPESEAYLSQALQSGHLSGDGDFTKRSSALLEALTGAHKALLTTSCTHALEMAGILLELHPGDEVIVPSFTFVSTVNAIVLRGAKPIFIDIRPDTLNFNEALLESMINPRTRAIFVVHYAGVGCDMDVIYQVASKHNIPVVEDNAHGLFGKYKGQNLGTLGALATQSFHETKNISTGEGGALLINDPRLKERAEIIREKGTAVSSEVRLINIPGSILAPVIFLPRSSPQCCLPSLSRPTKFKPNVASSGRLTKKNLENGLMTTVSGCLLYQKTANSLTICSIC